MMRNFMMRVRDAFEEAEIHAAHGVSEHECADTSGVALKPEGDHIQHEADMFLMAQRTLRRLERRIQRDQRLPGSLGITGPLQACLEGPYYRQVLINPGLIAGAQLGADLLRLFEYAVEQLRFLLGRVA